MSIFRSFLFAPGNHARRVEKSFTLGADAVILDLEDAVPHTEKALTRSKVVEALQRPRRCRGYVRVNALGTQWCHGDFVAAVAPGIDGIFLPKVESAGDLRTAEWLLNALERDHGLPKGAIDLIPIIETAAGYCGLREIAHAAKRVRRIAFGAGDFTVDLGIVWSNDENELLPCRSALVAESRAAGLEPPIDTAWPALDDREGFARSARRASGLGFQGKLCIHPEQVAVVNECFRPNEQELVQARQVLEAFAVAEREGVASIQVNGQFVDYPVVQRARRLVERAQSIEKAALAPSGPAGCPERIQETDSEPR